jgi:hypothetical protein
MNLLVATPSLFFKRSCICKDVKKSFFIPKVSLLSNLEYETLSMTLPYLLGFYFFKLGVKSFLQRDIALL